MWVLYGLEWIIIIKIYKFRVISPIYKYHKNDIILSTYTQNGMGLRLFSGIYGNEQVVFNPYYGKIGYTMYVGGWWNKFFSLIDEVSVYNKKQLKEYINNLDNYK